VAADAPSWAATTAAAAGRPRLSAAVGMLEDADRCAVSPLMIGRADQLAVLKEAYGAASGGEPAVMLVGGEAGIGKSRPVEEFAAEVTGSGGTVLSGGCLELGASGLPFAPFTATRDLLTFLSVAARDDRRGFAR